MFHNSTVLTRADSYLEKSYEVPPPYIHSHTTAWGRVAPSFLFYISILSFQKIFNMSSSTVASLHSVVDLKPLQTCMSKYHCLYTYWFDWPDIPLIYSLRPGIQMGFKCWQRLFSIQILWSSSLTAISGLGVQLYFRSQRFQLKRAFGTALHSSAN